MTIVWSVQSQEDLREIRKFIARDSPITATNFIRKLRVPVERLRTFPESGHVVQEVGSSNIRQIIFGQYRIIYECNSNRIEILAVFHGARLLDETEL